MANSSQFLLSPHPQTIFATGSTGGGTGPSFVSNWADKRSSNNAGFSLVIYSVGPIPNGFAWVELSNAPDAPGNNFGIPANQADDFWVASGSQTNLAFQSTGMNVATNTYQMKYSAHAVVNDPAHWGRYRFTASGIPTGNLVYTGVTGVATGVPIVTGLSAEVYFNTPFLSP
jgi:hypothetical protein